MTNTTPMRETMAMVIADIDEYDKPTKKHCDMVDAILSVLETPSEAVIQAGEDEGRHSIYRWCAMVKAIRGGA